MDEYIKKIKSFVGQYYKKDISYKKNGIDPARDWSIILVSVFILLIITAGVSFYFYSQIKSGNLFTTNSNTKNTSVKIDENLLVQTIEDINTRQAIFDEAQKNKTTVPDPSI